MRIAVNAASAEEVGCVQIKAQGDDLPVPPSIRSQLVTTDRGLFIEVTTLQAINDPALELVVTAGCSGSVSRQYVLLLDPPPLVATSQEPVQPNVFSSSAPLALAPPPARPASRVRRTYRAATTSKSVSGTSSEASAVAPTPSGQVPAAAPGTRTAAAPPVKPAGPPQASGRGDALRVTAPAPSTPNQSPAKPGESAPLAMTSNLPGTGATGSAATGSASAGAAAAGAGTSGTTAGATAGAVAAGAAEGGTTLAREQELEKQLTLLTSQVEALQQQMRTVSERNRQLEGKAPTNIYTWLLAAFALLALLIAAWFAWSYRSLQRSSASKPWFEQTQMGPVTQMRPPVRREVPREEVLDEPELKGTDGIEATEMLASDPFGGAAGLLRSHGGGSFTPPAPRPAAASSQNAPAPAPNRFQVSAQAEAAARAAAIAAAAASPAPPPAPAPATASKSPNLPPVISPDDSLESLLGISTVGFTKSNTGPTEAPKEPSKEAATEAAKEEPAVAPKPDATKDQRPLEAILDIDLSKTEAASDLRESVVDAMNPLDFELPALNLTKTQDRLAKEIPGAQQRIFDISKTGGLTASNVEYSPAEHASVQFRLTQFASVVERAKEMQRSGEPTKAIALLREYVLRDDLAPTMSWLMLFELYKQVDKKPVYDALADNFERRYKRSMVDWKDSLAAKTPQSPLALNQELDLRINSLWGTHEGIELLRDLTCGVDQPDRIVFNAELQRDLLQLAKVFPIDDTQ